MTWAKVDGIPASKRPGVYCLINETNGMVYVGSAISLRCRMRGHRAELRRGTHGNEHLQRAWTKYGEGVFRFDVLEACDPSDLFAVEQIWIDFLDACNRSKGYNICPVAGRQCHTAEVKAKMSKQRKGKIPYKATLAAAKANKGKHRPADVRERISKSQIGKVITEEAKANGINNHWSKRPDAKEITMKTAEANRGRSHSVLHRAHIRQGLLRYRRGIAHGTTA